MKILSADFVIVCNDNFDIWENYSVCIDKEIIEVGKREEILKKYPNTQEIYFGKNSILMPSLVNPHVHLEFSANRTYLKYGDFIEWLKSVIVYREKLKEECQEECYKKAINQMLKSGVGIFGEISSGGDDLKSCVQAPQKVVFFNEILGSQPEVVDILYNDFLNRVKESQKYASKRFIPSISIHSPYSTHPILIKKTLSMAKAEGMIVSTHFMESKAEREWIDKGSGDFKDFFKTFFPHIPVIKPLTSSKEFLKSFIGVRALFTHALFASSKELEMIKDLGGVITHCPISNRLLNNKTLNLKLLRELKLSYNIATDGLSSNISLNMWNELREALFIHEEENLSSFAKELLKAATKEAAFALGFDSGVIEKGKKADIIAIKLPNSTKKEDIAYQIILHTNEVEKIFIDGEEACPIL